MLRFAPTSIESWLSGNKFGYSIYRYRVVENKTRVIDSPEKIQLNEEPVLPLPLETIEKLYGTDPYAGVVAQAIYGSSFDLETKDKSANMMNLASELSNRYSFSLFACDMSVDAARSHGLLFVDKDVSYGDKYVYCVKLNRTDTFSVADSALIMVAVNDTFTVPAPVNVYAAFRDMTVSLSWEGSAMEQVFTAYNIERSDDGGKTFKKINKQPIINISQSENEKLRRMVYVDTIPRNEKEYFYRVRGITPFGEISPPSDVVSGQGANYLVGVNPMITGSEVLNESKLKIIWEFPEGYDEYVKGFTVERSDVADGHYVRLSDTLEKTVRTFTDTTANNVNYYQVCAISTSGNVFCSFPSLVQLPDSIPPEIPQGLSGIIDSSGIVTLRWNSNRESDFMSYRIYRSNNPERDFVLTNRLMISDTVFTDTIPLNNLSGEVYYAVSAQDKNYNESEKCQPLKILKPDTIAPVPPLIKNYNVTDKAITMEWISSTSDDVTKNLLYRKQQGEKTWKLIFVADTSNKTDIISDTSVTGGTTYEYMMIAVDESGLESVNNRRITIKTGNYPTTKSIPLKLTPGTNGRSVVIHWNNNNTDVQKILIYKALDKENMVLYRTLDPDENKYTDTEVKPGSVYNYCTQMILKNGSRSVISEVYTINL